MTEKIVVEVVDNGSINNLNKQATILNNTLKETQNTAKNVGGAKALAQGYASTQPAGALAQARASIDSNTARGIQGATGAASRDFAAQAQSLGGLVHVYATFAANLFAVSAAFTSLSKAADFTNMVKGLDQLGASSGHTLGSLAKRMTEVADGAISMKAAAEATAQASAGGLSGDQLLRLTNIAKTASQALGRDMTDALSRLTKGVIKIEPELLDELGIMVRVDTAAQNYARTLGKTAASLSEFEKRQSFAIAVLEQGEKKFNSIKLDANPYGKLLASLTNLAIAGGETLNKVLGPIAQILASSPTALMTVMTGITGLLVSKAIPALGQWREGLLKNAEVAANIAKQTAARSQEFNLMKDAEDYHRNIKPIQESINKANIGVLSALRAGKAGLSDSLQKQFTEIDTKPVKANLIEVGRAIQETKGKLQELHNESFKGSVSRSQLPEHLANIKAIELQNEKLKVQKEIHQGISASIKANKALKEAQNAPESKIGFSENVANRLAERSMQNFKKAQILSDVGQNTQIMGFSDAFKNMQEDIKKADIGKVSGFFTTIKGTAAIATSSVMSLASAFSGFLGLIGLAGIAIGMLDTFFTKNAKLAEAFSTSIETLGESIAGATRTIKLLEDQNPLAKFSVEGVQTRATAFNELTTSLKGVTKAFKDIEKANDSSFYDFTKNNIKKMWGGDNETLFKEGMSKAISSGLKAAASGTNKDEAKVALSKIFNTSDLSEEGLNKAGKTIPIAEFERGAKVLDALSLADNNAASRGTTLSNSLVQLKKDLDILANSVIPTDPLSKFGMSLMTTSIDMSKALQDVGTNLTSIAELSKDTSKLSLLPPNVATVLQKNSKALNEFNNRINFQNSLIDENVDKLGTAKQAYTTLADILSTQRKAGFSVLASDENRLQDLLSQINAAKKQIDLSKQVISDTRAQASTLLPTEKLAEMVKSGLNSGIDYLSQSLETAGKTAGLAVQKAAAAGMTGPGTAELNMKLQLESISVQKSIIDSNRALVTQQARLTLATEKTALEFSLSNDKTAKRDLESKVVTVGDSRIVALDKRIAETTKSLNSTNAAADAAAKFTSGSAASNKDTMKGLDPEAAEKVKTLYAQTVGYSTQLVALAGQEAEVRLTGALQKKVETVNEENRTDDIAIRKLDNQIQLNKQLASSMEFFDAELASNSMTLLIKKQELEVSKDQRAIELADELASIRINALSKDKKGNAETARIAALSAAQEQLDVRRFNNEQARNTLITDTNKQQLGSLQKVVALEEQRASIQGTISNNERTIAQSNLDTANTLYSLNQSIYSAAKANSDQSKVDQEYKLAQAKADNENVIEFFKIWEDRRIAYSNLDKNLGIVELALEMQRIETSAIERNNLRKDKFETASTLNKSNSDVGTTAVTNAKKIRDENARTTELMKTQESLAESLTNIFGEMGTNIGKMANSLINSLESQKKLEEGKRALLKDEKDPIKRLEIESKFKKDSAKAELDNQAKITSAAKGFFNEKSAGYKILNSIEKAIHIQKIGMLLIESAAELKAFITQMSFTGPRLAAEQAVSGPKAANALLSALDAPPPANFIAFATVAAMVASIMSAFGGGGAGSVSTALPAGISSEDRQKVQGTGQSYVNGKLVDNGLGVYGDNTAKSKSLANSIEIMKNNSIEGLDYDNKMLKAMERVADAVAGAAKSLYSIPGLRQGTNFGTQEGSSKEGGALSSIPVIGKLFGSLFGGDTSTTVSIVDAGVELAGTFKELMNGLGKIDQYKLVRTVSDTSGGWFGSDEHSDSTEKQLNAVNSAAGKAISQIFVQSADLFNKIGKEVGVTAKEIDNTLSIMDAGVMVSLKDLKGQDLLDEFNAVINSKLDETASILFKSMEKYKEFGEGFLETTTRVVKGNQSVNQAMLSMGAMFDVTKDKVTGGTQVVRKEIIDTVGHWEDKITHTNGKLIAGTVSEDSSFPTFGTYHEDIVKTTKVLVGFASHFIDVVEPIIEMSKFDVSESMVKNAGSLDNFMKQAEFFTSNFLTENERLKPIQKGVTDRLYDLGLSSITTRDQFKTLVQTINLSTVAGRDLYQSLMDLAPGFAQVTAKYEELAKSYKESEVDLLAARGLMVQSKALQRKLDTEGMDELTIKIYDLNKARSEEIKAIEQMKSVIEISTSGITTAIKDGFLGNKDAEQVGTQLADTLIGGVYNAFANFGANEMTKLINDTLIQPMINAALNGATAAQIMNTVSIDSLNGIVSKANQLATTLSAVFNDPTFLATMQNIRVAMSKVATSVTIGTTDLTRAADQASSVLSKVRSKAEEYAKSEVQLASAMGDKAKAEEIQRNLDIKNMSISEIVLYDLINARKKELDVLNERKGLQDQFNQLASTENELRQIQLTKLDSSNRYLQEQIYVLTDAKKFSDVAKGLISEIKSLAGNTKHATEGITGTNLKLVEFIDTFNAIKAVADQTNSLASEIFSITGKELKHTREAAIGVNMALIDMIDNLNAAKKNVDKTSEVMNKALTEYQDSLNAEISDFGEAINTVSKAGDKLRNVVSMLRGALDSLKIEGNQALVRQAGQADLASFLEAAKANPKTYLPDEKALSKALSAVSEPSQALFATFQDYQRDFYKTANNIADLSAITDQQAIEHDTALSLAKDQLKAAQDLVDAVLGKTTSPGTSQAKLEALHKATTAYTSAVTTYNSYKTQADALAADEQLKATKAIKDKVEEASIVALEAEKTNTETLSNTIMTSTALAAAQKAIADAVFKQEENARNANLIAAITAAGAATAAASAAAAEAARNTAAAASAAAVIASAPAPTISTPLGSATYDYNTGLYSSAAGSADKATLQKWVNDMAAGGDWKKVYDSVKSTGLTMTQFDTIMGFAPGTASDWAKTNNLPTFAMGGIHAGGLRLVGEKGPELEATGPARLYNVKQTQEMFSNEELLKEMKALREEVAMLRASSDQTAANTKSSKDTLIRVTQDGQAMQVNQI